MNPHAAIVGIACAQIDTADDLDALAALEPLVIGADAPISVAMKKAKALDRDQRKDSTSQVWKARSEIHRALGKRRRALLTTEAKNPVQLWGAQFEMTSPSLHLPFGLQLVGSRSSSAKALSKFTDLRSVSASLTSLTDDHVEVLAEVGTITWLDLQGTNVTDAGIAHLCSLSKLEYLRLKETAITDACIPHLAQLTTLQHLALHGTYVTEEGLLGLAPLGPELEDLWLGETLNDQDFTRDGTARISRALPATDVHVKSRGDFLNGECLMWRERPGYGAP